MDPEKIFKFLSQNLVEWSQITLLTLARPIARFDLVDLTSGAGARIVGSCENEGQFWLHPKLLAFAVFSIVVGLSINSLIPGRLPAINLLPSVVFIIVYWFMYASILHLFCIIFRGHGRYIETLSVILQLQATLYVVTSFVSLISAIILKSPFFETRLGILPYVGKILVDDPAYLFFIIGTMLSTFYTPLALRALHKFDWLKTILISLVPITFFWVSISVYNVIGIMLHGMFFN